LNCGIDKIHRINGMKAKRKLAPGLSVDRSKIDGEGCFTKVYLPKGVMIAEYTGERISQKEAKLRARSERGRRRISDIDARWCIDGSRGGNGTQYINHSCEPNCEVIVEHEHILIYALRDIAIGEEITTDYLYELGLEGRGCNCQTASCLENAGLARITSEDELRECAPPPNNRLTSLPPDGGCS
jgi:SET domain-containing protein